MLTKNMAWDIFQPRGRTMERKSSLFHVKASFEQPWIVGAYGRTPLQLALNSPTHVGFGSGGFTNEMEW